MPTPTPAPRLRPSEVYRWDKETVATHCNTFNWRPTGFHVPRPGEWYLCTSGYFRCTQPQLQPRLIVVPRDPSRATGYITS